MRSTIGNQLRFTMFGESHGSEIGFVLDGLPAGIKINTDHISSDLALRRPSGKISTTRKETDEYSFVSGIYNGYTTGGPLTCIIKNSDTHSSSYENLYKKPRPSHADYVADTRFCGFNDPRGGGMFSGRLTVCMVIAGSIVKSVLEQKGIFIGTHVERVGCISDRSFDMDHFDQDLASLSNIPFLDQQKQKEYNEYISKLKDEKDSIGGIVETVITGLETGLGEPIFDSLEGCLSHALYAIPAVKGVSFGEGFGFAFKKGSEVADCFAYNNESVITTSNYNGGINGGMSNGMPVVIHTCIKPTPSIGLPLETVDLVRKENTEITITGRHDPCIVHRAAIVVSCMSALVIGDMLAMRYGSDILR